MEHHIICAPEDISKYVILTRDPEKSIRLSTFLFESKFVSDSRGYYVYTGNSDQIRITISSTGVGGPQLAIGAEELAHMGSDTFIRLAGCQPLQKWLKPGDIIIPTGAYRGGTTANHYLPLPFPALPDFKILRSLLIAAQKLGIKVHTGINISVDALFANRDKAFYTKCEEAHALSIEMEIDTLFVMSNDNGWRSGAILIVEPDHSELGHANQEVFSQGEDQAIKIALEAIRIIETELETEAYR